jgi:hypothetical protein
MLGEGGMTLDPICEASHRLCAALHMENIDPAAMEIRLPRAAWWALYNRLEQIHRGIMNFDGRGSLQDGFMYMGVTYRVKE